MAKDCLTATVPIGDTQAVAEAEHIARRLAFYLSRPGQTRCAYDVEMAPDYLIWALHLLDLARNETIIERQYGEHEHSIRRHLEGHLYLAEADNRELRGMLAQAGMHAPPYHSWRDEGF